MIQVDDAVWFSFEQLVLNQKEGGYRLFKLTIKILTSMFLEWKGVTCTNENSIRVPEESVME